MALPSKRRQSFPSETRVKRGVRIVQGSGVARDLNVPRGHVIQSFELFAEAVMRRQSYFHPKAGQ